MDEFINILNGNKIGAKGFKEIKTNDVLINCFDMGKKLLFIERKDTIVTDQSLMVLKRTWLDQTLINIQCFVPDVSQNGRQFLLSLYREENIADFNMMDVQPNVYEGK